MKKIFFTLLNISFILFKLSAQIPDEFIKAAIIKDDGKGLETPQWKAANAKLKGVLAGYKPEMKITIEVGNSDVITTIYERFFTDVNDDGSFELDIPMVTTQQNRFRIISKNGNEIYADSYIVLSPGEETRFCLDLSAFYSKEAGLVKNKQTAPKILYFAGKNSEINNLFFDADFEKYSNKLQDATFDNKIAEMTALEFREYLMNVKNQCIADINSNPYIL